MTTNSRRLLQFQRQRLNHGTHGTHGKERGGNRLDGGDFPRVTEPLSETFAPQQDFGMTVHPTIWGGVSRDRGGFLRHLSDVQWLQGDTAICCNAPARRSGGRLCWEATCQGISWSPMRQWRVSPSPRFSARGLFWDWHIGHRSHASVNPYAVRHFGIPPNSRMNRKYELRQCHSGQVSLFLPINENRGRDGHC